MNNGTVGGQSRIATPVAPRRALPSHTLPSFMEEVQMFAYEASLGTLPNAQGWTNLYSGTGWSVSSGILNVFDPNEAFYILVDDLIDRVAFRARVNTGDAGDWILVAPQTDVEFVALLVKSDGLYSLGGDLLSTFDGSAWHVYGVEFDGLGGWTFSVDGTTVESGSTTPVDPPEGNGVVVEFVGSGATFDLEYVRGYGV